MKYNLFKVDGQFHNNQSWPPPDLLKVGERVNDWSLL